MIPKIIHYCWFGHNPLPPLALECISSWKKFLPDFEIKEWNEDNFDINMIPYTAEAYKQKKYAFVSDYARFWIIYNYGGIYFDTDVEVIRPMDDIISKGNFMGFELDPDGVNTPGRYAPRFCFDVALGLGYGMEKEHPFMKTLIDYYNNLKFELPPADISWYKTIVAYTTELLCREGLKNVKGIQTIEVSSNALTPNLSPLTSDSPNHSSLTSDSSNLSTLTSNLSTITIYPSEYFAPINVITGRLHITENTRTIHRYMGSWNVGKGLTVKSLTVNGIIQVVRHYLPEWVLIMMNKIKRRKYRIKVKG